MVRCIACHAPDGIPAHLCFGAVPIEHAHEKVPIALRWSNENESVGPYAGVAIGYFFRKGDGFVNGLVVYVDIDVVVSQAVHFDE